MKLIIDNSDAENAVFYLQLKDKWMVEKGASGRLPLLTILVDALKKYHKSLTDISGIAVLVGQGRFTATRIAVTLANSLAYAANVPVIGISRLKDEADFNRTEKEIKKGKRGVYVSAKYSGKVHISGKPEA